MRNETLALHAGFDMDPATNAIAVPIYQTVAYGFDDADHAAALFNLEVPGYRYSRIGNPTNSVLEQRVAALEGGLEALVVSTGQAALHYAVANLATPGTNLVSVPQLYGTTHSMFAHYLPDIGITVRFAESDRPEDIEPNPVNVPKLAPVASSKVLATVPPWILPPSTLPPGTLPGSRMTRFA